MAPTCDLCILVFCIVTAKCNVVCIELVCMDINTFSFMSICSLVFNVGQSTTQYSACTCTVWYFNLQWVQYTCITVQDYTVQAHCNTRLHCVVTAGAQKWPSIHPSLINQNQSLITMMIMIGVHREYRIGIW